MAMELVDSTALAAALPNAVLAPTTFSLWYDRLGRLTHVLALTDSAVVRKEAQPDSGALARARLGTVIAEAAFPQESGEMAVRLTIGRNGAGAMSLAVERSIRCSPVGEPRFHAPNERIRVTRDEIDDYQHARTALVTFVVDTTGHALQVLLTESSGSRIIDDRLVDAITSARYRPGTIDGFPKEVSMKIHMLPPIPHP